nr:hypothetical protein [Streptosporangium amethystogenes]
MRNVVEGRFDVRIQHPAIAAGAEVVNLRDRVVGPPPRPKPVRDRQEVGLEEGFQHQFERRLDDPVRDPGYAQRANPARSARLGDPAFPHRERPEDARLELGPQVVQKPWDADFLLNACDRQAVHAGSVGSPVARDPVERHQQRRRIVHEVEQVIEPAAGVGQRPTVKLGLHLRYLPARPHLAVGDLLRPGVPVRGRVFRHYSLQSFSKPLPPFPMCTGSPRLGVLRRLRPAPDRSAVDALSPATPLEAEDLARPGTVPVFTVSHSTEEEPDYAPAASL